MGYEIKNTPPKWDAAGAEPSADLQANGFTAGYKPPAAYFNYLFNQYTKCIAEMQAILEEMGVDGLPTVPISKGGTGATTAEGACNNIGALPLTGGTLDGILVMNNNEVVFSKWGDNHYVSIGNDAGAFVKTQYNGNSRYYYFKDNSVDLSGAVHFWDTALNKGFNLFGEHNKPSGSYTGNGSATQRTVAVGGIGEVLTITSDVGMALVTNRGAICLNRQTGELSGLKSYEVNYQGGVLTIATANTFVNGNPTAYWYQVL